MEVDPLIGPADDHHDHLGLGVEQMLVADRRFQVLLVAFDPVGEIEGLSAGMQLHRKSFLGDRVVRSTVSHDRK
jgi:hypothetical protein